MSNVSKPMSEDMEALVERIRMWLAEYDDPEAGGVGYNANEMNDDAADMFRALLAEIE